MKPDAKHLPGLELALSLFTEDTSPRAFEQKLDTALAQSRADLERASRREPPLDYAQGEGMTVKEPSFGPPMDYVPVAPSPFNPAREISTTTKVVTALVGAFMTWHWVPNIFSAEHDGWAILLNLLFSAFWAFMFVYSSINVWRDFRAARAKKLNRDKDVQHGKAVRHSNRSDQ